MKLDVMIEMLREEVSLLERCKGDAICRSAVCDDSLKRVLAFLEELKAKYPKFDTSGYINLTPISELVRRVEAAKE